MADTSGIDEAFELLLEEIEGLALALQEEGAEAFRAGQLDKARALLDATERVIGFREKVMVLTSEWNEQVAGHSSISGTVGPGGRLPRGLRTPESAYRVPILQSLVELGGRGSVDKVLEGVEAKIGHLLNDHDRKPLKSGQIRWRNTAMWCRKTLVGEGLLARDSPRGTWEITEKGRRWLDERKHGTGAADPAG